MKQTIVILHGWRLFGSKYSELQAILEKNNFTVFAPDFPGFGTEPLKKLDMSIDDYVLFLNSFFEKHKISKAILIGHSFGGRVAAKFCIMHPEKVQKLILTGAPLVRQDFSLKKKIMSFAAKKGKRLMSHLPKYLQKSIQWGTYRFIGEWDYYKSNSLKEVFKNAIAEDASTYIQKISSPTLVLWGKNDTLVPEKYGRKIAFLIPGAGFESISGAGHSSIYAHSKEFARHVIRFLKK